MSSFRLTRERSSKNSSSWRRFGEETSAPQRAKEARCDVSPATGFFAPAAQRIPPVRQDDSGFVTKDAKGSRRTRRDRGGSFRPRLFGAVMDLRRSPSGRAPVLWPRVTNLSPPHGVDHPKQKKKGRDVSAPASFISQDMTPTRCARALPAADSRSCPVERRRRGTRRRSCAAGR